jgi:hypothetical protein
LGTANEPTESILARFGLLPINQGLEAAMNIIPLPNTTELIQLELKRIVQPIPDKPREMHIVTFDRPAAGGETAASLPRSSTVAPKAGREE